MNTQSFIFHDHRGNRWHRAKLLFLVIAIMALAVGTLFVVSLIGAPLLNPPQVLRPDISRAEPDLDSTLPPRKLPPAWLTEVKAQHLQSGRRLNTEPFALGYYVSWDERSLESFKAGAEHLSHVVPEWLSLTEFGGRPTVKRDEALLEAARDSGVRLLPLLTNLERDRFHPEVVEDLARGTRGEQELFFDAVADELLFVEAVGVLVDFQQLDPYYRDDLSAFFRNFADALHRKGLELWLSVPVGDDIKAFDLAALAPAVDQFVALLFDETGEYDDPGPVASQPWWDGWFQALRAYGRPEQWVIGLGTFGYDWPQGKVAQMISFADSMGRASLAGNAQILIEPPLLTPHFSYRAGGERHSVWFLDAVTFRNQLYAATRQPIGGIAVYRLGLEDAGIWNVLSHHDPAPNLLLKVDLGDTVAHVGQGDFLSLVHEEKRGARELQRYADGNWGGRYSAIPGGRIMYHRGGEDPSRVALTFDDGPDPEWTPRILQILKRERLHATFFVVGTKAAEYPELVRRILREGHDLGNHSYWHSDLSESSEEWVTVELNATRRLLEGITGYTTLLFRPPYHAESEIRRAQDFFPLLTAQKLGYVVVNESIDSEDWNMPTTRAIVSRVKERRRDGNVVLLHDGGGDRSATVRALPTIIRYLRSRGDEIVPLRSLVGLPPTAFTRPVAQTEPAPSLTAVAHQGLETIEAAEDALWYFSVIVTALLLLRSSVLIVLAVLHRLAERRESKTRLAQYPGVSVLIAAYNEEKVIGATLRSLLASDYAGPIEVVVVDDGSLDRSGEIVQNIASADSRVRLLSQANQGKAAALQRALTAASHQLLVMLDADTQCAAFTVRSLVEKLVQPGVAAVSGYVKVGNHSSWLGRFQELEYLCGFHLDRRAYDYWNCITVIPGAVSGFQRTAIEAIGGILADTLAEDTDLTLRLHRAGYRLRFAPAAVGYTEAPETVRALIKQRVRWAFGTLQCLWKHRRLVGNPRYGALGLFSLPSVVFCHLFLVAMIPIVDGLLFGTLFLGSSGSLATFAISFTLVELVLAVIACVLARESIFKAILVVPMRFVYRPVLCIAVWRSLLRAMRGAWYGWGKLDRRGTVVEAPALPLAEEASL